MYLTSLYFNSDNTMGLVFHTRPVVLPVCEHQTRGVATVKVRSWPVTRPEIDREIGSFVFFDMKDKDLKLEQIESSRTQGWTGIVLNVVQFIITDKAKARREGGKVSVLWKTKV